MYVTMIAGWLNPEERIGILNIDRSGGKEVISIELDKEWIAKYPDFFLDPDIMPYRGRQFSQTGRKMFGFLSDASPDRWGRKLIQKKNKLEGNTNTLSESDYLLGVSDTLRYGGIRFQDPETGLYLSNSDYSIPPIAKLRSLENAARGYELSSNKDEAKWIRQIFEPGSSLGGARPKANVIDQHGKIWIAKFPSKNDDYDVGAWEMVEHLLAKACGINIPDARLMKLSAHGSTFLSERFDRKPGGKRLHMMSAMTLLSKTDGQTDGVSYLDIADGIEQICADPDKDLRELWKRIVFNVLTSNTDDHLRNHGFVLYDGFWHLSPAYDLNPVPYADSLSLNITEDDNRIILGNVINIAEYFRISKEEAIFCIENMQKTIQNRWRPLARQCGISEKEQYEMEQSFSECYETPRSKTRNIRAMDNGYER